MTDPTDDDLREPFARLREEEHSMAPAWRLPSSPIKAPQPSFWTGFPLPPLTLPAALAMLLCLGWLGSGLRPAGSDLSAELPELFTPQGRPLFSGLAATSIDMPSDAFLPVHLTLQLP